MNETLLRLSIRDLIDHRAADTPDKPFIIDPSSGKTVTYGDLQAAAQAVSGRLAALGLEKGESVAYAMGNGADAARVVLGILYGGHLATAINLVSGNQTIGYVIRHSGCRVIFCETETRELVEASKGDATAAILEVDDGLFAGDGAALPGLAPSDDGLLMYTSGTTGVPKGVLLSHQNLIAGGANAMTAHELTADDAGLCVLPLYHINGLCVTVLGALVSGSAVIIPKRFSVSNFWQHLRQTKGTWFSIVPTQVSYLLNEAQTNGHDGSGLEQIRFGRSASAPLSPDVQRAFEETFQVPVIETMGLTETAAQILSNPMQGVRKIGSPGIAYGNEIIIADDQQNEIARGEEGEVLVRGPSVMKGYLRNREATSQALTPAGWLRTGDLGRMDEDGYVFITGRIKELIIKGGENIAPREIDDALYAHPDVVEAAAFACDCARYGQRIEAGVKLRDGSTATQEELISLCADLIGPFKAPDRIHTFPELPKGPSGKIQRLKLAELSVENSAAG